MTTKSQKNKIAMIIMLLIVLAVFIFGAEQVLFLRKAHSTFENYYAFRGCAQLLDKTDDYGICKTTSGTIIKIVKFQNKWYLDGDLPVCWFFNICL